MNRQGFTHKSRVDVSTARLHGEPEAGTAAASGQTEVVMKTLVLAVLLIARFPASSQVAPKEPERIVTVSGDTRYCNGFRIAHRSDGPPLLLDECSGSTWELVDREAPWKWKQVVGAPLTVPSADPLRRTPSNRFWGYQIFRVSQVGHRKRFLVDTCSGDSWHYKASSVTTSASGLVTVVSPSWRQMERD